MDRKRWLVLIAAAVLALALFVGGALYLLPFPTGNTVVVRYKSAVQPTTCSGWLVAFSEKLSEILSCQIRCR